MPSFDFPSTASSPADIFHITLPDNEDDFADDSDESSALNALKSRLALAGSLRVQEFFDAASLDLRRKLAAVPQNDKKTRDAYFNKFMEDMRGVAVMQADEVEARVEMEKRDRDGIKGLLATTAPAPITMSASSSSARPSGSSWGGDAIAGPSGSGSGAAGAHLSAGGSISATTSVSEALYLEQMRLWDEAQITKAMASTSHHDDVTRQDRPPLGSGAASGSNGRPADVGASSSARSLGLVFSRVRFLKIIKCYRSIRFLVSLCKPSISICFLLCHYFTSHSFGNYFPSVSSFRLFGISFFYDSFGL
ncbi:hypothetical protein SCHPADRAFT_647889 [Schizopora paradoxa]|uniref:Uncharacterized protein n=1 Tax=Schizopora paradoxa TaxID=27342 RepID=A0A0H2RRN6_9AGAM|nr:hypothetical protein SCHPADRAFT_647889 [Schizopora paradoxa]